MWVLLQRCWRAFWFDEAAAQRNLVLLLVGGGYLLASGGVVPIPGDGEVVIPFGTWGPSLVPWGKLCMGIGFWLSGGRSLPTLPPAPPTA